MNRRYLWPGLLLAAAAAALLFASRRDLNEPHIRLFTDMVYSSAYKSQKPNPVFQDGLTQRPPVPGTIPRGFSPFPYGPSLAERERAGRELKNPIAPSYEAMTRGKRVFENDCSHCHGPRGRGDGPIAKAYPMFSFPVASPASYELKDGTLFHIITYGRNLMPSHASQVTQTDRWKVILYLRDLQRLEIARLGPLAIIPEDPRRHGVVTAAYGKELFAQNCAGCHGAEGRQPNPGIPTLNSPAVLAIAENEYYWNIINHGRPGTQMPAWKDVMTPTQIQSLVEYIRSWANPVSERGKILAERGDAKHGQSIYETNCVGCHGPQGKGGIGNSLSSPSFLAIASDQFLRDTIAMGRSHTAMPASFDLKPSDIADLIAYIRGWSPPASTWAETSALLPAASAAAGGKVFSARCSGCHGENGDGGIGSRLNSETFLPMVGDNFLYRVITEGRPGTEMPSWRFLPAGDVANLIVYIRAWQKTPAVALSTEPVKGRAEFGEVLFKAECQKCHMAGGSADLGMQIGNPVFGSQVSDQFLFRTIAYGKKGTEMKGFMTRARNPLSEDDIGHVVAYLRQLQKNPPLEALKRTYSWADPEEGRKVFEQKGGCIKCHGSRGEGGSGPSLGGAGFQRAASAGFISATLVLGRDGTEMKSYYRGGPVELSEEDIENVATYIKTFEKNPPAARRQVDRAQERVTEGRALFRQDCARCHGDQGQGKHGQKEGDFAPSLNNGEFLKDADDNFLLATIALGRPGTPMPPFAKGQGEVKALSADQIRKIVAFIRTWERHP
jgi:mono/diheme cytochrome c family protein